MAKLELTTESIKDLMLSFSRCGLTGLEIEDEGFKLSFSKEQTVVEVAPQQPVVAAVPSVAPAAPAPAVEEQAPTHTGTPVVSPIVGTFYAAASPEKPPFVTVGSQVKKGDVLFIIESMKLMNEITSEVDGTVQEICVQNGEAVEYSQPIMYIG